MEPPARARGCWRRGHLLPLRSRPRHRCTEWRRLLAGRECDRLPLHPPQGNSGLFLGGVSLVHSGSFGADQASCRQRLVPMQRPARRLAGRRGERKIQGPETTPPRVLQLKRQVCRARRTMTAGLTAMPTMCRCHHPLEATGPGPPAKPLIRRSDRFRPAEGRTVFTRCRCHQYRRPHR